jgi:hypothetical protein
MRGSPMLPVREEAGSEVMFAAEPVGVPMFHEPRNCPAVLRLPRYISGAFVSLPRMTKLLFVLFVRGWEQTEVQIFPIGLKK